jgi:hypothetical protein
LGRNRGRRRLHYLANSDAFKRGAHGSARDCLLRGAQEEPPYKGNPEPAEQVISEEGNI